MPSRNIKNTIKESFWMAIDSIRKNKLRSSLTLLGISIGVFSVIGVMTAIRTLESSVASGLNVFAANTFVIQKYPEISFGGDSRKFRNRKNITIDQYKKLKDRVKLPLLISPADGTSTKDIQYRGKKVKNNVDLFGGDEGTIRFYNTFLFDGRNFISDDIHYSRNDQVLERGNVRVLGDVIEVFPAYEDLCIRIELFGKEIETISKFDYLTGEIIEELDKIVIFPAKHFVTDKDKTLKVINLIQEELAERLDFLRAHNKLLEAQRLEQRTNFDIEMMIELGYCSGIENYSRYFAGRKEGEKPFTLIDFFPDNFLTVLDESHVTIPQIRAMYNGDRARKLSLVEHGFRLPSALDNRPLKYEEFIEAQNQIFFVSATPSATELEFCKGVVIEQILRPTGLLDPEVVVRKSKGQIDNLIGEIRLRAKNNERVLVTTLTKKMAEDLTDYLSGVNIKVRYLHSDINTVERVKILRDLRIGSFDVLIGINLLREGLDLPEVSLVAVIDADKEGFLRSKSSLLQVAGRAARNVDGTVILYADKTTDAMTNLIEETQRRRALQNKHNEENNIIPTTINKTIDEIMLSTAVVGDEKDDEIIPNDVNFQDITMQDRENILLELRKEMITCAENLDFEKAAKIRDEIENFEKSMKVDIK